MADFDEAYKNTMNGLYHMKNESLAVFDGGLKQDNHQIYEAIKRMEIVDLIELSDNSPLEGNSDTEADLDLKNICKNKVWDLFLGDLISDQYIAEELLDLSIHMGVNKAISILQEGINLLSSNGKNYPEIKVNSVFDSKTLLCLNKYLVHENSNSTSLLKVLNIFRGMYYIRYMKRNPILETYANSWLKKVRFI